MCCEGYAEWIPWFCDEEGDSYSVNHIYTDDDGDICLESDDIGAGEGYEFTVANILHRLKNYEPESYVYLQEDGEEDEDGNVYLCDFTGNWYTDYDDDGDETLYIDTCGIED